MKQSFTSATGYIEYHRIFFIGYSPKDILSLSAIYNVCKKEFPNVGWFHMISLLIPEAHDSGDPVQLVRVHSGDVRSPCSDVKMSVCKRLNEGFWTVLDLFCKLLSTC